MFNIITVKEMQITEIIPHPNQNGYYQENKQHQMLQDVRGKEPLYTVDWDIN
jgi:hypothetical protein